MIGKTLLHYEILQKLGSGGMGEVYQARDTKLGREVALKLLPQDLARDAERMSRFRREAKVLASLPSPGSSAWKKKTTRCSWPWSWPKAPTS
jgi:serine/threonine protein kinase